MRTEVLWMKQENREVKRIEGQYLRLISPGQ